MLDLRVRLSLALSWADVVALLILRRYRTLQISFGGRFWTNPYYRDLVFLRFSSEKRIISLRELLLSVSLKEHLLMIRPKYSLVFL
ncbi:hypothetical protein Tco_0937004 [Tanacetum coccineum]|uniref:Secreted protein n=1 Tax=Tanacetum coccineum TaxID=301880 RepID=A0ABQ5DJ69_9ASTR